MMCCFIFLFFFFGGGDFYLCVCVSACTCLCTGSISGLGSAQDKASIFFLRCLILAAELIVFVEKS